jgi:transposase
MATRDGTFVQWLTQAGVAADRLTVEQTAVLQAAFRFRQQLGADYYSTRLLSHFLLHCGSGVAVAQIARLLAISRPTASRQQGRASKEVVQAAHHRMAGRAHGKLLPRYAGPIAEFILTHTDASRYDILDFIERTWGVRVSTVALHHFCKKFGLDRATRAEATTPPPNAERPPAEPRPVATVPPSQPVPLPPPPFSRRGPNTRGRSS